MQTLLQVNVPSNGSANDEGHKMLSGNEDQRSLLNMKLLHAACFSLLCCSVFAAHPKDIKIGLRSGMPCCHVLA